MWSPDRNRIARLPGVLALVLLVACGGRAPDSARGPRAEGEGSRHPTGSVTTLSGEELERQKVATVAELLEGRVPGLQVLRQSNGEISLRIRGVTSLNGSNEPLVVIDGMPISQSALMSSLSGLNPADIARIDVLKDAASTAIYGMRGANGVIEITTKR